jgi:DNA (cytosine-5)-methyltransferase 1
MTGHEAGRPRHRTGPPIRTAPPEPDVPHSLPGLRPRLLDLFCCEGGAAHGYRKAGFNVHGYDKVHPDPNEDGYPGPEKAHRMILDMRARYLAAGGASFTRGDATIASLDGYDAVHASPPCKDHTDLASQSGGDGTGWMLGHTIDRLRAWGQRTGRPWVVENVVSPSTRALMDGAVMLCGSMFGLEIPGIGLGPARILKRHRLFLSNVMLMAPGGDQCTGRPIIGVYGTGGGGQMTRGYKATPQEARDVMGMPWASRNGCSQAIPPAYAEHIGEALMTAHLARTGP